MLERLERHVRRARRFGRAQRRLVADASHELRTPVTSLRTNIEMLERADELAGRRSARGCSSDVVEQLEELSALIKDLIELARGDEHDRPAEDVRLDMLVPRRSSARALQRADGAFEVDLEPTVVERRARRGSTAPSTTCSTTPSSHAGTDGPIEVACSTARLEVRDHGPGISPDDLPHIFDRFFRGAHSRSLPGSGLGLAIVRQVAELHAGEVTAANAPDGGAVFMLSLPTLAPASGPGGDLETEASANGTGVTPPVRA